MDIPSPAGLAIGTDILAVVGLEGYKERSPQPNAAPLGLSKTGWEDFNCSEIRSGRRNIGFEAAVDAGRSLTRIADDSRTKSIKDEFTQLAAHTLNLTTLWLW